MSEQISALIISTAIHNARLNLDLVAFACKCMSTYLVATRVQVSEYSYIVVKHVI